MEGQETVFGGLLSLLPSALGAALSGGGALLNDVTELRLRSGRPVCVCCGARTYFIEGSRWVQTATPSCLCTDSAALNDILARLSEYSLYARQGELARGFITVRGGHRVGIATSYLPDGNVDFGSINALNIRFARAVSGCAQTVFAQTQAHGPASVLLVSAPGAGKTTLLRDLVRALASPPRCARVALIDERRELAAMCGGVPTLDVGLTTDVLDGFPRAAGTEIAVRSLAPEFIACDELSARDVDALRYAQSSGVRLLATAHGAALDDAPPGGILPQLRGLFQYAVLLDDEPRPGSIKTIKRMDEI